MPTLATWLSISAVTAPLLAVLPSGDDAQLVGELDAALREHLQSVATLRLQPATVSARVLHGEAVPRANANDPTITQQVDGLFKEARTSFNMGSDAEARRHLDVVDGLIRRLPSRRALRARHSLWLAALTRDLQSTAAQGHIRSALEALPSLTVDLTEFAPSLRDVVERERRALGEPITLALDVVPADAQILLDGEPADAPLVAFPGKHALVLHRHGFRDVQLEITTSNAPAWVALPLALGAYAATVESAFAAETTDVAQRSLATVATKLGADCLLLTRSTTTHEAALWCTHAATIKRSQGAASHDDQARLANWVARAIVPEPETTALGLGLGIGFAGVVHRSSLSTASGAVYQYDLPGWGVTGTVGYTLANWFADATLSYLTFKDSVVTLQWPDGVTTRKEPGDRVLARGGLGHLWQVSSRLALEASIGLRYQGYLSLHPTRPEWPAGILPSSRAFMAMLSGGVRWQPVDVASLGRMSVEVSADALPAGFMLERPRDYSGTLRWAYGGAVHTWVGFGDRWRAGLRSDTAATFYDFKGAMLLEPERRARVRAAWQALSLEASASF